MASCPGRSPTAWYAPTCWSHAIDPWTVLRIEQALVRPAGSAIVVRSKARNLRVVVRCCCMPAGASCRRASRRSITCAFSQRRSRHRPFSPAIAKLSVQPPGVRVGAITLTKVRRTAIQYSSLEHVGTDQLGGCLAAPSTTQMRVACASVGGSNRSFHGRGSWMSGAPIV